MAFHVFLFGMPKLGKIQRKWTLKKFLLVFLSQLKLQIKVVCWTWKLNIKLNNTINSFLLGDVLRQSSVKDFSFLEASPSVKPIMRYSGYIESWPELFFIARDQELCSLGRLLELEFLGETLYLSSIYVNLQGVCSLIRKLSSCSNNLETRINRYAL